MDLMPDGASIVNIASIAALSGHFAIPYTASKWALRGLSRAASLELGPRGIRVNAVMPGLMATSMTSDVPQPVSTRCSAAFRSAAPRRPPTWRPPSASCSATKRLT